MASLGVVVVNRYHDGFTESFHEPRVPVVLTGIPPGQAVARDDGGFTVWFNIKAVPVKDWHAEQEGET